MLALNKAKEEVKKRRLLWICVLFTKDYRKALIALKHKTTMTFQIAIFKL